MKKITIIILIIINIFLINYKVEENTSIVISDNSFSLYELNTKLNTNNILNYINDEIKIIAIYPNNKLKNYRYDFTNTTNKNNINLFINEYRKLLNNNYYYKEANLISFNGIEISKIIISTNESNLYRLLETNKFSIENNYKIYIN